eukprot:g5643.t1
MSSSKCVECGHSVRGAVQKVPLTYFCDTCCRRVIGTHSSLYEGTLKVSATRARKEYGCSHEDLKSIYCSCCPNPVEKHGRPMRLYLRAEAQYLGHLRRLKEIKRAKLKERGAIIGKKIELEEVLGVRLSSIDVVVRKFLILDYLDHSTNVKTTLEDIEMRFSVVEKVQEILKRTPNAHPEAVFDYCLKYPDSTPLDFDSDRRNLNKVFHLEGARILFMIPESEREKLVDTPLINDYKEFLLRDSRSIISSHLQRWISKETAEEILSCSACEARLRFGGEESGIAEKLYQFWKEKDNPKLRQERLMQALKAKNLPFISDDHRLLSYINGQLDCDVEDLVGEVEVEHRLVSGNHRVCFCCVSSSKQLFTECRHSLLLSYEEAIEHAVQIASDDILWHDEDSEEDSDYDFNSDSDSFASYFTDDWGGWHYYDDDEDQFLNFY